jgi:2-dehydro-3-deoxygluconokinase
MIDPPEVLAVGEACALLLAADDVPLTAADRFVRSVAGAESNVAIALARLGHATAFCGRVGADAAGRWVVETLRAEGVDVRAVRVDPDRPTGLILRDTPPGRPLTVNDHRRDSAGAALGPEDLDPALVAAARVVVVTGITSMLSARTAACVERLLELAADAGTHVVLDPNVRLRLAAVECWARLVRDHLDRIDTLLLGDAEVELLGLGDPAALLRGRLRTVVVKNGARGAVAFTEAGPVRMPARAVPVVDPVGAGDAFDAGWISARLRGLPVEAALREAVTVASLVVATRADLPGLPTARERDLLSGVHGEDGPDVDR